MLYSTITIACITAVAQAMPFISTYACRLVVDKSAKPRRNEGTSIRDFGYFKSVAKCGATALKAKSVCDKNDEAAQKEEKKKADKSVKSAALEKTKRTCLNNVESERAVCHKKMTTCGDVALKANCDCTKVARSE